MLVFWRPPPAGRRSRVNLAPARPSRRRWPSRSTASSPSCRTPSGCARSRATAASTPTCGEPSASSASPPWPRPTAAPRWSTSRWWPSAAAPTWPRRPVVESPGRGHASARRPTAATAPHRVPPAAPRARRAGGRRRRRHAVVGSLDGELVRVALAGRTASRSPSSGCRAAATVDPPPATASTRLGEPRRTSMPPSTAGEPSPRAGRPAWPARRSTSASSTPRTASSSASPSARSRPSPTGSPTPTPTSTAPGSSPSRRPGPWRSATPRRRGWPAPPWRGAASRPSAAATWSLHVHGGYGFMVEYAVHLYVKRAKAVRLAAGPPRRRARRDRPPSLGRRAGSGERPDRRRPRGDRLLARPRHRGLPRRRARLHRRAPDRRDRRAGPRHRHHARLGAAPRPGRRRLPLGRLARRGGRRWPQRPRRHHAPAGALRRRRPGRRHGHRLHGRRHPPPPGQRVAADRGAPPDPAPARSSRAWATASPTPAATSPPSPARRCSTATSG